MPKRTNLIATLLFLVATIAPAMEAPYLVKDIQPDMNSSQPHDMLIYNGQAYFSAMLNGSRGVWRSDGTADGTVLFRDFAPGQAWGDWSYPVHFLDKIYFVTSDDLWCTDGTEAGTTFLLDPNVQETSGSTDYSSGIKLLTVAGGKLFFVADAPDSPNYWNGELWVSDGSVAGTTVAKEIRPGTYGADIYDLISTGSHVVFAANDGTNGRELWISNGTTSGTRMVSDIYPGSASGNPGYIQVIGNHVYFTAVNATGPGIYRMGLDGTSLELIAPMSGREFTSHDGLVFFRGYDDDGGELWSTDGTEAGTQQVLDIASGSTSSTPQSLVSIGDLLYFSAETAEHGRELWVSDGTAVGTIRISDCVPGAGGSTPLNIRQMPDGSIAFTAHDDEHGREWWTTDGSAAGTTLLQDLAPGTDNSDIEWLEIYNGERYFTARGERTGLELWATDGSVTGTRLVKDIYPGGIPSSPDHLFAMQGELYFSADADDDDKSDLWRSDGTSEGTRPIFGPESFHRCTTITDQMVAFKGEVAVTAEFQRKGRELVLTDGSQAGTRIVKDILPGVSHGSAHYKTVLGDYLYYVAYTPETHNELWRSDGTEAGTMLLKDIFAGTSSSYTGDLTVLGDQILFSARNLLNGTELWRTDGTSEGTVMVKDINPTGHAYPDYLTVMGDYVYFGARSVDVDELWRSDGTEAGTTRVSAVADGGPDDPRDFCVNGGILYFSAESAEHGRELWRSDGTAEGTVLVKDIYPGTNDGHPDEFTVLDGIVYFQANDGVHGFELWRSDGTAEGTTMVADLAPGSAGASAWELTSTHGRLFFSADDGSNGRELWMSDGSQAGTTMLAYHDGITGLSPRQLTPCGDRLYCTGLLDGDRELFALDLSSLSNNTPPSLVTPAGGATTVTMLEDGVFTPPAIEAIDDDGDTLQWSVDGEPANGTLSCSGSGSAPDTLLYTPEEDWYGTDQFIISARDAVGAKVSITITVEVEAVNDPPSTTGTLRLQGDALYATNLYALQPSWRDEDSSSGLSYSFQWLRDGVAIPGATSSWYTITGDDVGHTISANNTATDSGYPGSASTTITSDGIIATARPLTAVLGDVSRSYGADNPTPSLSYSGFYGSDSEAIISGSPVFTTTAAADSPVGSYAINLATDSLSIPGYTLTADPAVLTVTAATLTVSADTQVREPGTDNPTLTYSISGFQNGEDASVISGEPTLSTSANAASPIGSYAITVDVAPLSAGNYSFSAVDGIIHVTNQTHLTVAATNLERSYGSANPALVYTITGFRDGDDIGMVSGEPVLSCEADIGSAVGSHPITVALGTLVVEGYHWNLVDGSLTISPAALTVSADDQLIRQGMAIPTLSYSISGYVLDEDASVITGEPVLSTSATADSISGSYPITVDTAAMSASNYSISGSNGSLTISEIIPVTITATDYSRVYGDTNPALTYSASGFLTGDDMSIVSGAVELSCSADQQSGVGSYPITVSVASLVAEGYSFSAVDGSLTITPAELTISAADLTMRRGTSLPTGSYTVSGFKLSDDESLLVGSPLVSHTVTADSPVGIYPITVDIAAVSAANYDLVTVDAAFTVYQLQADSITLSGSVREDIDTLTVSGDGISPAVNNATIDGGSWSYTFPASASGPQAVSVEATATGGEQVNHNLSIETIDVPVEEN